MPVLRRAGRGRSGHSQDSIGALSVEEFCLNFDTPKSVFEIVKIFVVVLAEVDLVGDNYTIVVAAFSITLVKSASIISDTIALRLRAGVPLVGS